MGFPYVLLPSQAPCHLTYLYTNSLSSCGLQGRVCGLCGNFDDNAINDFTTRSQSVVGDVLEFGNSWKFSPSCPDAPVPKDPCIANPYRKSWAQKKCSIINSATFAACHSQVGPGLGSQDLQLPASSW